MRHKIICDFEVQTAHLISARIPDQMIVNKKKRKKKKKKAELIEWLTLPSWQTAE